MGKTKTSMIIGDAPKDSGKSKYDSRREKKRAERAKSGKVPGMGGGERIVAIGDDLPPIEDATTEETKQRSTGPKVRGKRYLNALSKIDPNKRYPIKEAVELAKQASVSRFTGKLELHVTLDKKGNYEVSLPHTSQSSKKRIEIASDETIKKLEKGTIDFDVLLATPAIMPRLAPFARVLGPKGLMPNPKNGTVTNNPEVAVAKFSGNTAFLKTEKDAPVIHTVIGSLEEPEQNLAENTQAILKSIGSAHILKAVLVSSMGPGIKVAAS